MNFSADFWGEKQIYLKERGFKKVVAADFYRELFPLNSLECEMGKLDVYPKTNKGNAFVCYKDIDGKFKTRFIFDDLNFSDVINFSTAFMSPISYFGRRRTCANARELYAMTFDLDNVGYDQIRDLFQGWINCERAPRPTYIVNSGGGLHLYYFFEKPIPMYPKIQQKLKQLKYALTDLLWNGDTSALKTKQYQGINQGFRLVGGKTKYGQEVTAWKTGERVTLEYLNKFVAEDIRILTTEYTSTCTLEQAKEKYPEWYHQRIELGRQKQNWTCNRALYDWWLKRKNKVELHHRYFYVMCLAIYAVKCGIDEEELKTDAFKLIDYLNKISPENPFIESDVESALEMYQDCYRSFPRDEIANLSGIEIKANKRNGRTRVENLEVARFIRDLNQRKKGTQWNGRKSVEKIVNAYLLAYPNSTWWEFEQATGLKKSVFYKYKKQFFSNPVNQPSENSPSSPDEPQ